MTNPILSSSASHIADMIRSQKISAVEVAQAFIAQIDKVNPTLNALHDVEPEKILHQAQLADKAIAAKQPLGRLHGVPITLKDSFYVPGFRGCKASFGLLNHVPQGQPATVARRLVNEGAIILGISNVPEFLSAYESDNLIYGRTNNPYDYNRTAGGSSGGEAAIIAAGGSPLGIGTDAGGSIRLPAHYCGISGFKPTRGAVPITGNIPTDSIGLIKQLICYGPMSKHVDDLILAFSIIRGPDNIDFEVPPVTFAEPGSVDVSKLKVAYFLDNGIASLDSEMEKIIRDALSRLASDVASMEEKMPSVIDQSFHLVWETFFQGGDKGAMIVEMLEGINQEQCSPLYQTFLNKAKTSEFSLTDYKKRFVAIDEFRHDMYQFMQDYDILISPVAASFARHHGTTHDNVKEFSYTMTYNLTGWPVVVIPCGVSSSGLPVGIQIAAKSWADITALAAAKVFQQKLGILSANI